MLLTWNMAPVVGVEPSVFIPTFCEYKASDKNKMPPTRNNILGWIFKTGVELNRLFVDMSSSELNYAPGSNGATTILHKSIIDNTKIYI